MALRRQVKNVVKNFSDIEVKVREATSNDPWGPSSSLTSEIADATYNVQAFTELMTLLWKRLNDHGKNWRHVYKSLVVLDYIVKTGSERVAQQCRENIFAIKTLKDFQFIDKDGKDQGINVREKSKQLVALLKDDERLKAERQRALKAKERFTQAQGGIGNTSFPKNKKFQPNNKYREGRGSVDDLNLPSATWKESDRAADSQSTDGRIDSEIEKVRPSNELEEEMQLQIALAMSREEAEKTEHGKEENTEMLNMVNHQHKSERASTLLNLSDLSPSYQSTAPCDPWGQPTVSQPSHTQPVADPWSKNQEMSSVGSSFTTSKLSNADPWSSQPAPSVLSADPWSTPAVKPVDPWGGPMQSSISQDPFGPNLPLSSVQADPFAPKLPSQTMAVQDPFGSLSPSKTNKGLLGFETNDSAIGANKKSSFLPNGAHLVDVDNILSLQQSAPKAANPFMTSPANTNPFLQDKPKPKSINEMRNDKVNIFSAPSQSGSTLLPTPLQPANKSANNPFL